MQNFITKEILQGLIRHCVAALGVWLVQHGYVCPKVGGAISSEAVASEIAGAVLALLAVGHSVKVKIQAAKDAPETVSTPPAPLLPPKQQP